MPWTVSSDIDSFLGVTSQFLRAAPVENTVLLTEAQYLAGRPRDEPGQRYGWWSTGDGSAQPTAAFLQAPRHPPILSPTPVEALPSLVDILADQPGPVDRPGLGHRPGLANRPGPAGEPTLGIDGRMVDDVVDAWRDRTGIELVPLSRIRLYRLTAFRPPATPPGRARIATLADRELLVAWFRQLMAQHPDDPSDLSYVVDDPIGYGGMVLWEVDGRPQAMAGRSRLIAGMVRLGPVWSPGTQAIDGPAHAALVAACAAAAQIARDVLIFASVADASAHDTYLALGFTPVLDRVMLAPRVAS